MTAAELYRAMCEYVTANGWQREEPGSGWWWHDERGDHTLGGAVDEQLYKDGIDTREEPAP